MLNSTKMALSGLISALCLVIMLIAGIIPFDLYSLPAISGIILIVIVFEIGQKWAIISFLSISLLSALIVPNKESSLVFIMFFGYYPILKIKINSIKNIFLKIIIKSLVFNIAMIAEFFIAIKILSIPEESFNFFGFSAPFLLFLMGNFVFWIYDKIVSDAEKLYLYKLRYKIKKIMRF